MTIGIGWQSQEFTTVGAFTYHVPEGVTCVLVTVVGGGAGGATGGSPGTGGAGGGSGERCYRVPVRVTSSGTVAGTVGAKGVKGDPGTNGGATIFGPIQVAGGFGGTTGSGGVGGVGGGPNGGAGGIVASPGSPGIFGTRSGPLYSGGAGGAGGGNGGLQDGGAGGACDGQPGGAGGIADGAGFRGGGGGGGASRFGPGGVGGSGNAGAGADAAATAYGAAGGGGAAASGAGGDGAAGYCLVQWLGGLAALAWNPADGSTGTRLIALSNSNRTLTTTGTLTGAVRSTTSHGTGKYYFECVIDTFDTAASNEPYFGIVGGSGTYAINTFAGNHGPFGSANDHGIYSGSPATNWRAYQPGANRAAITSTTVAGDVWGFAIDFTLGRIWFHKNGTYADGDPGTNTSPTFTTVSGTYHAFATATPASAEVVTGRFTRTAMAYTVPSGFLAWDGT